MMKKKTIKAWAGFVDDKIDIGWWDVDGNFTESIYSLFKTKKAAKVYFDDVRPVTITL